MSQFSGKNPVNCQNQVVYDVSVMRWSNCIKLSIFWAWKSIRSQVYLENDNISVDYVFSVTESFRREGPKTMIVPLWWHLGPSYLTMFSAWYVLCEKSSAIDVNKNWIRNVMLLGVEWPLYTGGLGLTEVTPLMNQELLIQFFDFLIAEVFFHEIHRAADGRRARR